MIFPHQENHQLKLIRSIIISIKKKNKWNNTAQSLCNTYNTPTDSVNILITEKTQIEIQ